MRRKNKKKYIAIFVVKEKDTFAYEGSKKLSPTSKTVKFKKGTYYVDIANHTYSKGLKLFYFIDVAGEQLEVIEEGEKTKKKEIKKKELEARKKAKEGNLELSGMNYDPEVLDMILSKNIVSQLTANLSDNAIKLNIITLVIGAVMGGLFGYILAGVI